MPPGLRHTSAETRKLYHVMRAGMFMEPLHMHPNDEYLMFISSDPHDMKNLATIVEVAYGSEQKLLYPCVWITSRRPPAAFCRIFGSGQTG